MPATLAPVRVQARPAFPAHDPSLHDWLVGALRRLATLETREAALRHPGRTAPPPPRLMISADELLENINRELGSRPEGERMVVGGRGLAPGEPDDSGCNWRPGALIVRMHGYLGPRAFEAMGEVVAAAQRRYNLVEG